MREGPLSFSPAEWHLLEAVLSAPEDDAPRLVLADALQARGEAFGEFIALQVALAAAQVNWETWAWNSAGGARGLREKMLPAMLDEVLAGTRDAAGVPLEIIRQRRRLCDVEPSLRPWAEFFVPGATDVGWQRGFPHEVTVPARALLEAQATLTPLRKLEVTDGDELDPVTLVAHPWVVHASSLTLSGSRFGPAGPGSHPAPQRPALTRLTLGAGEVAPHTVARLAPALKQVQHLVLPVVRWSDDDDFTALGDPALTPALRELTVDLPHLAAEGAGTPISPQWRALVARAAPLVIHVESTKLSADRLTVIMNEHSTWESLAEAMGDAQVRVGAPTGGSRWRRWRF